MSEVSDQPISSVKGVGPRRKALFDKLEIRTVLELLNHFPRDYEDRSDIRDIADLAGGQSSVFKGRLAERAFNRRVAHGMTISTAVISDETGAISAVWFNQNYIRNSLFPGTEYVFFGKVEKGYKGLEVQNPVFEKAAVGDSVKMLRIVPIYPTTAELSQNAIRGAIFEALQMVKSSFEEFLPEDILSRNGLCDINFAYESVHFPESSEDFLAARKRFVFQELFLLQLALLSVKNAYKKKTAGAVFGKRPDLVEVFIQSLPFELTGAQKRVVAEVETDMRSGSVMSRLIQGDVGSGKTAVAAVAMLDAALSGCQAALMAPTEILARQHFKTLTGMMESNRISLLTGTMPPAQKKQTLEGLRSGEVEIVVGTHAIIQENVEFKKLGLVITDEQHRFGVRQRAVLAAKGDNPHMLVMSATPIPRTLALILYGDLDISVIDELPPGRKPIETYSVDNSKRDRINNFIRGKVGEQQQVYIVCPLIEASDDLDARAAEDVALEVSKTFGDLRTGIIHGRMKSAEKDAVMTAFAAGGIDVLVSTTVIEVGVDVPNATVMIVENADRFGLAQLHQLRGRVGRGGSQSYCIMFNESKSEWAKERMKTMRDTNDGFVISEKDLEIRGPGEFFGAMQHGLPELKISNLYKDIDILKEAQKAAIALIEADPMLESAANAALKANVPKLSDVQL